MPDARESPSSAPVDARTLWRAVAEEPSLYVWVVNEDGLVRYVNESGAQFYLDRPAEEVEGQSLQDLFPATFTRERLRVMRKALATESAVRFPTYWGGQWLCATVWPVTSPERGVLVIVRQTFQIWAEEGPPMLHLSESDEKPLSDLSPTERLVLAGIGEGWSTAEIARRMYRSSKTIEWYRGSLGRRLSCSNRVELARIALLSGLSWERALGMCNGKVPR